MALLPRVVSGRLAAIISVAVLVISVAVIVGGFARCDPSADEVGARAPSRVDRTLAKPVPPALVAAPEPTPPAALPASLDGSEPDGAATADAAGHLVIDRALRRLFDYYLSASGEEPLAVMRARIAAALRARLPTAAADEAIAILDRYLAYRDAARDTTPTDDPAAGLAQIHDLRAQLFPPAVVAAFFADEEAAIYAAIARRDAMRDPTISAAERDRRIAELDARLPPAVREARAAATAPIDQMNRDDALRAAGASDAQIAAARSSALGADAAARLAELDRARAAWDARLAAFRAERAALSTDPQLSANERDRRIAARLAEQFTDAERIRIEALDRISHTGDESSGNR